VDGGAEAAGVLAGLLGELVVPDPTGVAGSSVELASVLRQAARAHMTASAATIRVP
jgi:hypothetical protein